MPFLIVDELMVEMPQPVGANSGIGPSHVQLSLSAEKRQGAPK